MREIYDEDPNVDLTLKIPGFVNMNNKNYILSKKYTNDKEGFAMKKLNKKMELVDQVFSIIFIMEMLFFILGDALFGHLGAIIIIIMAVITYGLLLIIRLKLKNKKLQLIIERRR